MRRSDLNADRGKIEHRSDAYVIVRRVRSADFDEDMRQSRTFSE